ncbi:MAG: PQQ-binding-like beta-propeller repeat protein [Verrucomicrobia subdivision 3 bacterium]|nr:PQQ-binding-like beta-propeller repeat protein [Limisphaerales bacterium]
MAAIFRRFSETHETRGSTPFTDRGTGFSGWRVRLDTSRAVPTPAAGGGRVYVGAGFGSYDFYSFDALTGRQAWHLSTTDDGPTAAVLADGFVLFNTESCTLEIVQARSGERVWHRWLGDPLLAQPAVMNGRVFMVYPKNGSHWLGAFALADGAPLWETRLDHDVITAPVVAEGRVYLSTFDGTVWCIQPENGRVQWSQQLQATSAPWIFEGDVFVAQREEGEPGARESGDPGRTRSGEDMAADKQAPRERTSRHDSGTGRLKSSSSAKVAEYLSRHTGAARKASYYAMDSAVGFGHSPSSAKLHAAEKLIGENLVSRAWRFQGSRPVVVNGILYETTGDRLEASDARTGEVLWSWHDAAPVEGERRLTPPAVANGHVWAGTWDGRIISWDALTGDVRWAVPAGAPPCHWQPVASGGWIFAGLEDGSLLGFATGDPLDDGWPMWGGGCGHNGTPLPESPPPSSAPPRGGHEDHKTPETAPAVLVN